MFINVNGGGKTSLPCSLREEDEGRLAFFTDGNMAVTNYELEITDFYEAKHFVLFCEAIPATNVIIYFGIRFVNWYFFLQMFKKSLVNVHWKKKDGLRSCFFLFLGNKKCTLIV